VLILYLRLKYNNNNSIGSIFKLENSFGSVCQYPRLYPKWKIWKIMKKILNRNENKLTNRYFPWNETKFFGTETENRNLNLHFNIHMIVIVISNSNFWFYSTILCCTPLYRISHNYCCCLIAGSGQIKKECWNISSSHRKHWIFFYKCWVLNNMELRSSSQFW
jgi:hypothetical protein